MNDASRELDGADVCVLIHTGLRKGCDSKITTAAYNLIHILTTGSQVPRRFCAWHLLGDLVAEKLSRNETPWDAYKHAMEEIEEALHNRLVAHKGQRPAGVWNVFWALHCTFSCFTDQDVEGMLFLLDG